MEIIKIDENILKLISIKNAIESYCKENEYLNEEIIRE